MLCFCLREMLFLAFKISEFLLGRTIAMLVDSFS